MAMKIKLVVVETHPIQYKAPLFRLLADQDDISLTVLYAMLPDATQQGAGFGVSFEWDQPLLDGYDYEVLDNRCKHPSVTRFGGCDTPDVRRVLERLQPDVVLVNGWVVKTCLQTVAACRRLGVPCMVRGEANLLRKRAWWKHILHRILLRRYTAYLAIGSANRAFYRYHGCDDEKIFDVPYVVDNDYFTSAATQRMSSRGMLRKRWGIRADATVFLFAGKLVKKKHPEDVLSAFAMLPESSKSRAHVLYAGSGPMLNACRSIALQRELPVTFLGFMNQSALPDAYAVSDVLVLPSDTGETWGLVVNEAMASGLPAIVSRSVGCCQDLIHNGRTGYAFDVHDLSGLAECMDRYIREPQQVRLQGQNAMKQMEKFSMSEAVRGLVHAVKATRSSSREDPAC
jgi:glycosyltransferase involved in cell wall biosynthesis